MKSPGVLACGMNEKERQKKKDRGKEWQWQHGQTVSSHGKSRTIHQIRLNRSFQKPLSLSQ
jgi:hypothetical protein